MTHVRFNHLRHLAASALRFMRSDALIVVPLAMAAVLWLVATVDTAVALIA